MAESFRSGLEAVPVLQMESALKVKKDQMLIQGTGSAVYNVAEGYGTNAAGEGFTQSGIIQAAQEHLSLGTVDAARDVYVALAGSGYTMGQAEKILGLPAGTLAAETAKLSEALGVNLPTFATGGMHKGGARIVGENGPELEVTGPARIWNASQTANMLGSSSGNDEDMQALRAEVRAVVTHVSKLSRNIERLIVPTDDGEALQTKAVPA